MTLPKGQSNEVSPVRVNKPGVYRHRHTGAEFITIPGDDGVVQADALLSPVWKDAWERVGDVPTADELLRMRKAQEKKDAEAEKPQPEKEGK
jgi:hypothetical protein